MKELTQGMVEAFDVEMPIGDALKTMPVSVYQGHIVRAAVKAGWIDSVDPAGMKRSEVKKLADEIISARNKAEEIDPS